MINNDFPIKELLLPSDSDLKELRVFNEPNCISIYAPFIEETGGISANRLQLKNLLREAEHKLAVKGIEPRLIRKTTARARNLLKQTWFWHLRGVGLAFFMHQDFFRYYQLPDHNLPAHVTVNQGFDIEPLLRLLENDELYYVLSVSHNHARLYQGGHYAIREIKLKDFPASLKEDLRLDEYEHWAESHTISPDSFGHEQEAYHGQYNQQEIDKEELFRFFRHIDSRLHKFLRNKKAPLIFAGVSYLMPIYQRANTYRYLVHQAIEGNADRKNVNLLRKEAWSLLSAR